MVHIHSPVDNYKCTYPSYGSKRDEASIPHYLAAGRTLQVGEALDGGGGR